MALVAVLPGLRFLQQQRVGDVVGDWAVLDASGYDEHVAGPQRRLAVVLQLDPE